MKKLHTIEDIKGKIYFTCSACMSVLADALSWANANQQRIVKHPKDSDNIVVLACQVTDLAVENDLNTIEALEKKYPDRKFYISGCLAKRKDIDIKYPRLIIPKTNYQQINNKSLIHFEKPFWIDELKESDDEFKQGNLFRNMYPLRIGQSCPFDCTYCTIKMTRGKFEEYNSYKMLEKEFLNHEDVLLIADSPMPHQIRTWCSIAKKHNKKFSIRNVEPQVMMQCKDELLEVAKLGLLKVFHAPIQSNDEKVLKDMNRNVKATFQAIKFSKRLKKLGVFIATNIIIDYKEFKQDFSEIYDTYDYVSWNPFWNGVWNRKKAKERFDFYIKKKRIKQDTGVK